MFTQLHKTVHIQLDYGISHKKEHRNAIASARLLSA